MPRASFLSACIAATVIAAAPLAGAEPLVLHFDTDQDLAALRKDMSPCRLVDGGVSGKAVEVECLFNGNWFGLPLAKDWPKGVLTAWIKDPLFAGGTPGQGIRAALRIGCRERSGGQVSSLGIDTGRESPYWWFNQSGPENANGLRLIPRRDGWTRVDVINPGGDGPHPFILAIDGREVLRTPRSYVSIEDFGAQAAWGGGTILIDELSYHPDPAAYRPNVLQAVEAGDEAHALRLAAGTPLAVGLRLAAAGARAGAGTVAVRLLDGRESAVSAVEVPVSWPMADERVTATLPTPPRSGRYWLAAEYREAGQMRPDSLQVPIDIAFDTAGWTTDGRQRIPLEAPWSWLPAMVAMDQDSVRLPAESPTAVPTDWSLAQPVTGMWYTHSARQHQAVWAAWHRRQLRIPAGWAGRRVLLDIDDVQTRARVFANGVDCGVVAWPGGQVDLTAQARPGQDLDLCLYVTCFKDAGYTPVLTGILGKDLKLPDWLSQVGQHRGLRGKVALVSEPAGPRVDAVAITTPGVGSETRIELAVETAGLTPGSRYRLRAAAASAGRVVKEVPAIEFTAGDDGKPIRLATGWPDARRWDLGAPWLYDLVARLESADGKTLDTTLPERFGVRDLRFDGRFVGLNGRHVNLFMPMVWYNWMNPGFAAHLDRYHYNYSSGYHLTYFWNAGNGGTHRGDEQLEFSDEAGMGTDLPISSIFLRQALAQQDKHEDPRYWSMHDQVLRYAARRHRNHPSLFFWDGPGGGGNLTMGCMFNPLLMDGLWIKDFTSSPLLGRKLSAERRAIAAIKAVDPSRPVVAQDSGNLTDAIHITHYAGFMPNQEVIESTGPWVDHGVKPWFITEQTAPFALNWTNACRAKGGGTNNRFECVGEFAAISLGDRAFERDARDHAMLRAFESTAMRIRERAQQDKPIADPAARAKAWADMSTYHPPMFAPDYLTSRFRDEVEAARHREQWLNWRADGIGLLCAWGLSGSPIQETALAPLTGFLAGPPGLRTDKTHILAPGETVVRSAVLLNNHREQRSLGVVWRLELDGIRIAGGTDTVTVPAGGVIEHPISLTIPPGGDRLGRLVLELAEAGRPVATDETPIEVIAPRPCRTAAPVALIDPEGDSAKALAAAGVRFRQVPFGADLTAYQVVILGRRAFRYELKSLSSGLDLGALTRSGKRILVLEQDEPTLRGRFSFRTEYISAREVYGRIGGHPALDGLPDRALRFWRGAATLTDGYAVARDADLLNLEHNGARWFYPWNDGADHARPIKWGNSHNVATVMVIKPDAGGYRPIIDGEYAHNYAAAWELEQDRGRVVFCQLDVSGRSAADPAAARLLANLVEHCANAPVPAWHDAAYLGGPAGAALLDDLRIPVRRIASPAESAPGDVLVVGEADTTVLVGWKDALAAHAQAGGTVFVLPKPAAAFAAGFTPFPVSASAIEISETLLGKPKDPLLAGLGNGDLYWKGFVPVVALGGLPAGALTVDSGILAAVAHGRGRYVLCQFAPDTIDVAARFWQREPQQWAGRAIRQMLTNLGTRMDPARFLAPPRSQDETVATIDLAGTWKGCAASDDTCPAATDARWQDITVPGFWENQRPEWAKHDGTFWYRRTIQITDLPAGSGARIVIGAIKDEDDTYINGRLVGHIGRDTHANDYFGALRDYPIPAGLLLIGGNEVAIRVRNLSGQGGIAVAPAQLVFTRSRQPEPTPIDLTGTWQAAKAAADEACPPAGDPRWHDIRVPGSFQEQHADWAGYNGVLWYRRSVILDQPIPAATTPLLSIGAVDDEDDTWLNGVKIGHIGVDTNPKDHWMARRAYPIPAGLLKQGANELRIRCHDIRGSGGITTGPVRIDLGDPEAAALRALRASPYLRRVGRGDDPYLYNGW